MDIRFLTLEETNRALELATGTYRPREILDLQEAIAAETRAAELNSSVTGEIDGQRVSKILQMKFQLDRLYAAWVDGQIK